MNLNLALIEIVEAIQNNDKLKVDECIEIFNNTQMTTIELFFDTIYNLNPPTELLIYALKHLNFTKDKESRIWQKEMWYYSMYRADEENILTRIKIWLEPDKFNTLNEEQISTLIKICVSKEYYTLLSIIRNRLKERENDKTNN